VPVGPPAASDAPTAWTPDFDETDDLGGLLAATSPLLARAFRAKGKGAGQDKG